MDALIKITTFGSALLISYGLARFLVLACVEALLVRSFASPQVRPQPASIPAGHGKLDTMQRQVSLR
jgi:hypothetical protein